MIMLTRHNNISFLMWPGMGSMGTGSVSSAASYIDISGYVDSAPYRSISLLNLNIWDRGHLVPLPREFSWVSSSNANSLEGFPSADFFLCWTRKLLSASCFLDFISCSTSKQREHLFLKIWILIIFQFFSSIPNFFLANFEFWILINFQFFSSPASLRENLNNLQSRPTFSEENIFGPFLKKIVCSNVQNILFKRPFLKKIFLFKSSRYFLKKMFCSKVLNVRVE